MLAEAGCVVCLAAAEQLLHGCGQHGRPLTWCTPTLATPTLWTLTAQCWVRCGTGPDELTYATLSLTAQSGTPGGTGQQRWAWQQSSHGWCCSWCWCVMVLVAGMLAINQLLHLLWRQQTNGQGGRAS